MLVPRALAGRGIIDAALLVGWLALLALLARAGHGDAGTARELGLVAAAGLFYAGARVVPRPLAGGALLTVASSGAAVVLTQPAILSGGPTAPPFGYGNANGAFLAACAVAAVAALVRPLGPWRWLAGAELILLVGAIIETRSAAATALAVVAVVGVLVAQSRPAGLVSTGVAAVVLAVATIVPLALAAGYTGAGSGLATSALSDRRVALWQDGWQLAGVSPWSGGGLGSFPVSSPTARMDADTRFAHSLPLELAAEAGVPAALTLGLLVVLLLLGCAVGRASGAAWALVVFVAQASIDYTYRYPAVVLAAAVVAGLAGSTEGRTVRPPRPERASLTVP